jgi:uncharacterized protein
MPFPAVIFASSDDPYASRATTEAQALAWNAALIDIGPAGHLSDSLGAWPQGQALLAAFVAGPGTAPRQLPHREGSSR